MGGGRARSRTSPDSFDKQTFTRQSALRKSANAGHSVSQQDIAAELIQKSSTLDRDA